MGVDPISIAAELGAGWVTSGVRGKVATFLQRRECRRQLARNVWTELVKRNAGRFELAAGCFDADALWEWTAGEPVREALLAADPVRIREQGASLRSAWRSSSYESKNPLSDEDCALAAELVYHLVTVDVLAGDELLGAYASRLLDAVEGVHNDLALVCVTLAGSIADPGDVTRRRLAILGEEALKVADRGIVEAGGDPLRVERVTAEHDLHAAIRGIANGSVLVVTGQPDVGKSHLTMCVARTLRQSRDVFAVDLRRHRKALSDLLGDGSGSLREALIGGPEDGPALLVIDGAEAIQTDGFDVFLDLVAQARESNLPVVAVSRADAASDISQSLASRGVTSELHKVEGLTDDEIEAVCVAIPRARQLVSMPSGAWLARRPGLLQAWLVTGATGEIRNEGHLVELLRNQYVASFGTGRSARLASLAALARAALGAEYVTVDSESIDQLRANGVLAQRRNSWDTVPMFADDLWRDVALAGIIADEPAVLLKLSGTRSALHASVVACQLRTNVDHAAIGSLVEVFDRLSAQTGQARWSDVPFEALVSFGGTADEWARILAQLEEIAALERFLAVARRTPDSMLNRAPLAMSGLVDALLDCAPADPEAQAVVRAWLEAAAIRCPIVPSDTRRRVCERLLSGRSARDETDVETWLNDLAMCAVDLSEQGADVLRRTALERPDRLNEVFLRFATGHALAESKPELLVYLCEQYYIPGNSWSMEALRAPFRGLGADRVGAFHTPIGRLLQVRPVEALALACRLLDAACGRTHHQAGRMDAESSDLRQVEIDLVGRGPTKLLGDGHEWAWYRGGLSAPASAVSILLALERFADHLVSTGGSVDWVTRLLLRGVSSPPIVGLCVGLSIRHLDLHEPSDSFLHWAGQRSVWELENARVTHEQIGFGFIRSNDVASEDRRAFPMSTIIQRVAVEALSTGNEAALRRVEATSTALEVSGSGDLLVTAWACGFRPSLMEVREEDGERSIVIAAPAELVDGLAAHYAEWEAATGPDNVAMRYVFRDGGDIPLDHLVDDVAVCRSESASGTEWGDARVLTAAAVVRSSLTATQGAADDDLAWAVEEVLRFLQVEVDEARPTPSPWRPVHAAASALPVLWAAVVRDPSWNPLLDVRRRVAGLAERLSTVGSADVLWTLLAAQSDQWRNPCTAQVHSACPNQIVADIGAAVLRRAVRRVARQRASGVDSDSSPTRYVDADLLLAPLALMSGQLELCEHVQLRPLVVDALALHSEAFGAVDWQPHADGYHFPRLATALFDLIWHGEVGIAIDYICSVAPSFQSQALQGIRQVAGDRPEMRPRLERIWPTVMSELNGALTHDDDWADPASELIPVVMVNSYSMTQPDAWNEATANWIDPRAIDLPLRSWAQGAVGCGRCAAALGAFLLACDAGWVRAVGLPLVRQLVVSSDPAALRQRRAAWLADIPNDRRLSGPLAGNEDLLAIIDRYVQADDPYALIARQQLE